MAQPAPRLRRPARRRLEPAHFEALQTRPHRLAAWSMPAWPCCAHRLAQLSHAGHAGVGGGLSAVAALAPRGACGWRASFWTTSPASTGARCRCKPAPPGINTTRVYNPIKQAQDHDPQGAFVRRWQPHLRHVPHAWLLGALAHARRRASALRRAAGPRPARTTGGPGLRDPRRQGQGDGHCAPRRLCAKPKAAIVEKDTARAWRAEATEGRPASAPTHNKAWSFEPCTASRTCRKPPSLRPALAGAKSGSDWIGQVLLRTLPASPQEAR